MTGESGADGKDGVLKHWLNSETYTMSAEDTTIIKGDFVLDNSYLILTNSGIEIISGTNIFKKYSQIYVGKNLVLNNSIIVNDGQIQVTDGIILLGNSSIIGTGIII